MLAEKDVYALHADQYDLLIRREDYQENILPAIEKILSPEGLEAIDLGAGTGRLTRLLAPRVHSIRTFDASASMLTIAAESLRSMGQTNWHTAVADHRSLPAGSASADLIVSGWSFCYLSVWGGDAWLQDLESGYKELVRVIRPGGAVIIFETLGTGKEEPDPPKHLNRYFDWLAEKSFQSTWIRTDYRFQSLDEALELGTFFFGEEMGDRIRINNWLRLPECTGVWWKHW
ncbi:MAG: class I SAM-dependent methyltransferase [Anaerolineales bacterium]|nr:class I SAM-dependent methyltransferase [Anaerolineales bacterium]